MFRKPIDLLTVLIGLPILLLFLRAWTASQPDPLLRLQTIALGFLVALYCAKALFDRCIYHRTDGILAANAQRIRERLTFVIPMFGVALALSSTYLLVVDAYRPKPWLAATLLGIAAGLSWGYISHALRERQPVFLYWLRPRQRTRPRHLGLRCVAGCVAGVITAILPFEVPAIAAAVAASSLIVSVMLGRIDATAIRYRTMIGNSSSALIRAHALPLLAFFVPYAAALALAPHWAPAAIASAFGLAVVCLVVLRVLAYQSFHQRIADWFVTALIAASAMVGLALPPAAPVVLLFGIVWLVRRAGSQAWLIA